MSHYQPQITILPTTTGRLYFPACGGAMSFGASDTFDPHVLDDTDTYERAPLRGLRDDALQAMVRQERHGQAGVLPGFDRHVGTSGIICFKRAIGPNFQDVFLHPKSWTLSAHTITPFNPEPISCETLRASIDEDGTIHSQSKTIDMDWRIDDPTKADPEMSPIGDLNLAYIEIPDLVAD